MQMTVNIKNNTVSAESELSVAFNIYETIRSNTSFLFESTMYEFTKEMSCSILIAKQEK